MRENNTFLTNEQFYSKKLSLLLCVYLDSDFADSYEGIIFPNIDDKSLWEDNIVAYQ